MLSFWKNFRVLEINTAAKFPRIRRCHFLPDDANLLYPFLSLAFPHTLYYSRLHRWLLCTLYSSSHQELRHQTVDRITDADDSWKYVLRLDGFLEAARSICRWPSSFVSRWALNFSIVGLSPTSWHTWNLLQWVRSARQKRPNPSKTVHYGPSEIQENDPSKNSLNTRVRSLALISSLELGSWIGFGIPSSKVHRGKLKWKVLNRIPIKVSRFFFSKRLVHLLT